MMKTNKAKRLSDLTEQERITFISILQGGNHTNRPVDVAWNLAKIFAQAGLLGFALLGILGIGWIIGVATGG